MIRNLSLFHLLLFILLSFSCFTLRAQLRIDADVVAQLDSIYAQDQTLRERLIYMDQHWRDDLQPIYDSLWTVQKASDSTNMLALSALQRRYGWEALMQLDSSSKSTIFLVIQHSDSLNQTRFLPKLLKAVKRNVLPPRYYALLKDRITLLQCNRQYYGTQYYWDNKRKKNTLFAIVGGPEAATRRREELGLVPLPVYLKFINGE